MLHRSTLLITALIASGVLFAQDRILDPYLRTVSAHVRQWFAVSTILWTVNPDSRVMTRFTSTASAESDPTSFRTLLFNTNDFPGMVRFTSRTTSVVDGAIRFLTCQPRGVLWAVNESGKVCRFDGSQWTILERLCTRADRRHACYHDAILQKSALRIITCDGIVNIDLNTSEVTHLISVPSWSYEHVRFDGWDTVRIRSLLTGTIALASGEVCIDDAGLAAEWDSVNVGKRAWRYNELHRTLALRNALLPNRPWTRADTLVDNRVFLCGGCCGSLRIEERVYCLAVDGAGTMYVGTDDGIVVLPDSRGVKVRGEVEPMASLTLAPNPAQQWTRIELDEEPIDGTVCAVTDAAGRVVQRMVLRERSTPLDLTGMAVGMYYVMVVSPRSRAVISLRVSQ